MIDEKQKPPVDLDCVGFNLDTQKLLCLMLLNDQLATALSDKAGEAFFRAFIVEDRLTGEIHARQRFRYVDHDSWSHLNLNAERQKLGRAQRVAFLQEGIEKVLREALRLFASAEPPKSAVLSFFPPDDEGDGVKTIKWLMEQNLIHEPRIESVDESATESKSAPRRCNETGGDNRPTK
jgi:hypothetical protein